MYQSHINHSLTRGDKQLVEDGENIRQRALHDHVDPAQQMKRSGCSGLEHSLATGRSMQGCKQMTPKEQHEHGHNGGKHQDNEKTYVGRHP